MAKPGYGVAYEYRCVDCGGPRSIGSAQRCSKCYFARVDERRVKRMLTDALLLPRRRERTRKLLQNRERESARQARRLARQQKREAERQHAAEAREKQFQDIRFAQLCVLIRKQKEKRKRRERYIKPAKLPPLRPGYCRECRTFRLSAANVTGVCDSCTDDAFERRRKAKPKPAPISRR